MSTSMKYDVQLMQDFLPVRPISAANHLRALRLDSNTYVFAISTDNVLQLIYQDDDVETTAWSSAPLLGSASENITVTSFGVARDPSLSDRFRLAACVTKPDGTNALYVSSMVVDGSVDWEDEDAIAAIWTELDMPDATAVGNEVRIGNEGHVLLATTSTTADAAYYLYDPSVGTLSSYALPENGAVIHQLALGAVRGNEGVFLLYDVGSVRTMLFQSFPHPFFRTTFKYRFTTPGDIADFFIERSDETGDVLYTCGADVCAFVDPSNRETIVSGDDISYSFSQIRVVDNEGKKTIWLRGDAGDDENILFYLTNQYVVSDTVTSTKWTTPLPMMTDVGLFACEKETAISNHVYIVTDSNELRHLYQDAATSLWRKETISLEDTGIATEISSYVITAKFYRLPYGETTPVSITADSSVMATVNESSKLLTPGKSITVDVSGDDPEICIAIPVEDLSAPNVTLSADFLDGGSTTIDVAGSVADALAKYETADDIKNAVASNGEAVFTDDDMPEDDTFAALAEASQQVVSSQEEDSSTTTASRDFNFNRSTNSAGLRQRKSRKRNVTSKVIRISFKDGNATCSVSEKKEESHIASRGLFDDIASGFKSAGRAVGDFVHTVGEGIVEFGEMVIETVEEGLSVVVDAVGGFIISTFQQVTGFLTAVFKKLKVAWEKLKALIAFLFNFKNILETKKMIANLFNSGLTSFRGIISSVKTNINADIDDLKTKLGANSITSDLMGPLADAGINDSVNESAQTQAEDEPVSSKDNWMSRKVRKMGGDSTSSDNGLFNLDSVIDDLGDSFSEFGDTFSSLVGQWTSGDITTGTFILEILKGIGIVVLDAAQTVTNTIFDVVETLFDKVVEIFNKKITIPVLSSLFETFFGIKLEFSLLDAISFILAVPSTIIVGTLFGKSPHEILTTDTISTISGNITTGGSTTLASRDLQITSRSTSTESFEIAGKVLGIIGGAGVVIKAVAMALKKSFNLIPFMRQIDCAVGVFTCIMGMARFALPPQTDSGWAGFQLAGLACLFFIPGSMFPEDALHKFIIPGALTVLSVFALKRYVEYVAGNVNVLVEMGTMCAIINWFFALPGSLLGVMGQEQYSSIVFAVRVVAVVLAGTCTYTYTLAKDTFE